MDFDTPKVYGDISIFDGLPLYILPVLPEGFRKALLCVYFDSVIPSEFNNVYVSIATYTQDISYCGPLRPFHVCCLCHHLAFPTTPCCVSISCRAALSPYSPPAAGAAQQGSQTQHDGPQAEDGPGPQRARPLLHVWGQHALRDQGWSGKDFLCEVHYVTLVSRTTSTPLATLWLILQMALEWCQR